MGPVPMDSDGISIRVKGLAERSNCARGEEKGVRNVVVGNGQVLSLGSYDDEESKSNGVAERINSGSDGVNRVPAGLEILPPQGPVIHWERFLPKRSLKVLLVEYDDSTRHVVSALLRNCSYEVTAVANGLQAWRILEDLTNHVDLVLTEVVMPILSGIGLLCKIMSHKTLKNLPVIMMSPHDSMGLVFRCLSNGAVDFLVKPIRKNELKNLWQHVWRRCHSSSGSGSGSGSESGTEAKIYAKSKCNDESENNAGSSDEHDNGSIGLSIKDGSDNGSGTQSSWTKRASEVDGSISLWHRLADTPDSTCAQVIHTKPETFSSRVHVTEKEEFQELDEQLDNVAMGKNLETCISGNPNEHLEYRHKISTFPAQFKLSQLDSVPSKREQLEHKSKNMGGKGKDFTVDFISAIASCTNPQVESQAVEAPNDLSYLSQIKDNATCHFKELPPLELTLKRLREEGNVGTTVHDDRNGWRHSESSAFSKYNTASSASQAPTGNVGSCSPPDNSSIAMKTELMHKSNDTPPTQQSNGSSNNIDMPSTIKYVSIPDTLNDKSESVSAFKCFHTTEIQHVQNDVANDVVVRTDQVHAGGSNQQVQVQHHHHHYHHHHHHVHNMQHQSQLDNDDLSLKNLETDAFQCGSSDMLGGSFEGNGRYYSVNGSGSGSKHGSNEQNGSSKGLNAGVANMESDNGATGKSGVNCISGRVSGSGADEDQLTQRKAALTKFHQKRKERCFEKKVRYQNRKRLAEQRPRIRGQFVRHIGSDIEAGKGQQDSLAPKDKSCDTVQ